MLKRLPNRARGLFRFFLFSVFSVYSVYSVVGFPPSLCENPCRVWIIPSFRPFRVFCVFGVFRGWIPTQFMRNSDEFGSSNRLIYENESYAVIGAALDVYYRLGSGFREPVYQEALEYELELREIPFTPQNWLTIKYKDRVLKKKYRADFVCFEKIIVEIKAETMLTGVDWSQLMNYMKASGFRVGLLFNFGSDRALEKKRVII